jgi:hypothetical protein
LCSYDALDLATISIADDVRDDTARVSGPELPITYRYSDEQARGYPAIVNLPGRTGRDVAKVYVVET